MKMNAQEQAFLSTLDLPFNRVHLDNHFTLLRPDGDPGGEGYWLLLQGMSVMVVDNGAELSLPHGTSPLGIDHAAAVYIGQWQGAPCRAVKVEKTLEVTESLQLAHLRAPDQPLSLALLSLAGMGQMILHWEEESLFCGNCSSEMVRLPGEWGKQCSRCGVHHFPRIHPCVIGLVIKGDEILLAHKAEWSDGRYGLVAGFVEFGECLEEAMAREVFEETNIRIRNVRYVGSQSWPFPSQLMCGFVADYAGGEIRLNDHELADARWFKVDELPTVPPRRSIARFLIDQAREYIGR